MSQGEGGRDMFVLNVMQLVGEKDCCFGQTSDRRGNSDEGGDAVVIDCNDRPHFLSTGWPAVETLQTGTKTKNRKSVWRTADRWKYGMLFRGFR
eukprot:649567-Hanusia_phi.AAC.2